MDSPEGVMADEPVTYSDPLSAAAAEQESGAAEEAARRRAKELSSLSGQVRELELELAQTKLALVETQCKNQVLVDRVGWH